MIDICTVVFREEIPILRLQAESVGKYCNTIGIRNIYVVVNDTESVVNEVDANWWGNLAPNVIVIPRTVFGATWSENGWVSQQVLKILASSMSYNTWTMTLDAKTIFVRDVNLTELLDDQGRAKTGQLSIYPVFEQSRQIVNATYNIDLQRQLGPGGVPFLFHNNTVRSMIVDTTSITDESFPEWFQSKGTLTEFLLYSGYVESKDTLWESLYNSDKPVFSVCNICHSEVDNADFKFNMMENPHTLTVSIHRHAWEKFNADQKQKYKNLLLKHGISGAFFL